MRTIEEFRTHQVERLGHALRRPTMVYGDESGPDTVLRSLLIDLCWIDDRMAEWDRVMEKYIRHSAGILGQLRDQDVVMPDYLAECTSSWAQVPWALGYYQLERLLTLAEWVDLKNALNRDFFHREWGMAEINERFGTPSYQVGSPSVFVSAYACEGPHEPWVFLDFARAPAGTHDWYPEPRLRDVRIKKNQFQLLEWAKSCRRLSPFFYNVQGRNTTFLAISVISIEGDHLNSVSELLCRAGYSVDEVYSVESGKRLQKELRWRSGSCSAGRLAIAAWLDNGWTHLVDTEKALVVSDSLLEFSKERQARIFGWHCGRASGCMLISKGSRVRDVLYSRGVAVVDRGEPLPEESHVDWRDPENEDILNIAARMGATFDLFADRKYLVYHVDRWDNRRVSREESAGLTP